MKMKMKMEDNCNVKRRITAAEREWVLL